MALTLEASGTQAATIGTDHDLSTLTSAKTFIFVVDRTNMVAGDVLELRIKTKVLSGSTLHGCYIQYYNGAPNADDAVAVSVPIPSDISADFRLKQTSGTGRSYDWKVLSL